MISAPGTGDRPLEAAEFSASMAGLGPFESSVHIAAGVSGGADSLALAVLLHAWAGARGGRVTALTVDHGLRPGAAREARRAGRTLRSLGIAHRVLRWEGPSPTANLQAEARHIRYDLLEAWCARHGVLHLALAHHRDDQAETLLLRLGRGSGLDGLAAMSPARPRPQVRFLRPLLAVPKARLAAGLAAAGLGWSEDPTNRDRRHARTRLRVLAPALAAEGLSAARLAATAARLGRARHALERSLADLLARAARVHPAGHAQVEAGPLTAAPDELALRALARILTTVGGLAYGPRLDRLERLLARLRADPTQGATLGGCRILARAGAAPHLLIAREVRGTPVTSLRPGETVLWDHRFEIAIRARGAKGPVRVAALGRAGWAALRAKLDDPDSVPIPALARPSLPAFSDAAGLLAVPHLGYRRPGPGGPGGGAIVSKCLFTPKNGLTAAPFTVA